MRFLESEEGRGALYADFLAGVLAGDKIIQQFLAFDNVRPTTMGFGCDATNSLWSCTSNWLT